MSINNSLHSTMVSKDNCGVCGQPLTYGTEPLTMQCQFCGQKQSTLIYCGQGHFVCDACHQKEALDIIREVVETSTSTAPVEILEDMLCHPGIPMHGPEHHAAVPAAILAAVRNAGHSLPEGAMEAAIQRGSKVPGGWCGYCGACGAGIGVGIAVSSLLEATPVKGKPRRMANEATSYALSRMLNNDPRCCKRASRRAMKAAVEFFKDKLGIELSLGPLSVCVYSARNRECPKDRCAHYPKEKAEAATSS